MKKARDFFNADERSRICEAIEAAEVTTSGEIVTMVVDKSNLYLDAQTTGAVLVSGLLSLAIAWSIKEMTIRSYVPMAFLLYFPARHLFRHFPAMQMFFVNRHQAAEAVRQRAIRAFFETGLHRTRDETGMLIFISLMERRVWILGDRAVNAKIPPPSWQRLADAVAAGVQEGRACEALCEVISMCGEIMREHFPASTDLPGQLPDKVLVG